MTRLRIASKNSVYSINYKVMQIREIKEFLKQRGINPHMKIERNGRVEDLFQLLHEFNDIVKRETKIKIVRQVENADISD